VPAAATGLIPVEVMPIKLDIASSYETQDRGRKNSRDVPPLVLSVCSGGPLCITRADKPTSVDALRIEPRSEHIGTGEIRR
jgi:hypothetical protein